MSVALFVCKSMFSHRSPKGVGLISGGVRHNRGTTCERYVGLRGALISLARPTFFGEVNDVVDKRLTVSPFESKSVGSIHVRCPPQLTKCAIGDELRQLNSVKNDTAKLKLPIRCYLD